MILSGQSKIFYVVRLQQSKQKEFDLKIKFIMINFTELTVFFERYDQDFHSSVCDYSVNGVQTSY